MQVQVQGLAELRAELRKLEHDGTYLKEFREAGKRSAGVIIPTARAIGPHRSGRLVGTLRPLASGNAFAVAIGSAGVPYAGPIHWGWAARGITAQPFIVTAADLKEREVTDTFVLALDRITARAFPGVA